jgi:hypothetical protein
VKSANPTRRYLFALCCYDLKKLPEAESALSAGPGAGGGGKGGAGMAAAAAAAAGGVPNGAAGLHLLGVICKDTGRRDAAVAGLYELPNAVSPHDRPAAVDSRPTVSAEELEASHPRSSRLRLWSLQAPA